MGACALMLASGAARAQGQTPESRPEPGTETRPVVEPAGDAGGKASGQQPRADKGNKWAAKPTEMPATPDAVQRLLDATYLTDEERKDLRVRFGRFTGADLDSPARAARAALVRGAYDDPALLSDQADPLDAAEAMLMRGEWARVLERVTTETAGTSMRAARLRAAALELAGKADEALELIDATALRVEKQATKPTPESVTEGARLVLQRLRLRGPSSKDDPGRDAQTILAALTQAHTTMDRQYWPAMLVEAELLNARDNKPEALDAVGRVLELNPTCAQAWGLMGRLLVDSFQMEKAEAVARRLDVLASRTPDGEDLDQSEPAPSVQGAEVLARTLLRQSEGAQALEALTPALERFPQSVRLRALEAACEGVRFDFAKARTLVDAETRRVPGSISAALETGKALSEARQYGPAKELLTRATKDARNDPEPFIELGLMSVQAAQDDAARAALEHAVALDPFNVRADNSLKLVSEVASYLRFESDHFIVRCKGPEDGADALLAREILEVMENNHRLVAGPKGIDHEPVLEAKKTYIDLMPDHAWFAVRIVGMSKIHTIAASTGPLIAMEAPREGPKHTGLYDWDRVLRHEYTHTVTLSRTNNRIPHWFTEASAVYMELSPRDYQTCQLLARALETGTLFDFNQINLAFVRPRKASDRGQAYAQGHWMYEFMIERFGARAPLELMDKYAQGVREEEAVQQVLGRSRAQFMDEFKAWARTQTKAWGLTDITPTIRQLQAQERLKDTELSDAERSKLERIAHPPSKSASAAADDDSDEERMSNVELPAPTAAQIDAWLAAYPAHPDVLELAVDQAVLAAGGKATAELEPLIERYAKARPVDPKPHRLLARMYLDMVRNDPSTLLASAPKAIEHLKYLDEREQKTPVYAMELARRYAALKQFAEAKEASLRAVNLAPYDARTRELAATVALQAGDLAGAEHQIVGLTILEPDREQHRKRLEAVRARLEAAKKERGAVGAREP